MAAKEKGIVIEIDMKTGEVKAEALGYQGTACSLDMEPLMNAMGKKTKHTPKAPEKDQTVARVQRA